MKRARQHPKLEEAGKSYDLAGFLFPNIGRRFEESAFGRRHPS